MGGHVQINICSGAKKEPSVEKKTGNSENTTISPKGKGKRENACQQLHACINVPKPKQQLQPHRHRHHLRRHQQQWNHTMNGKTYLVFSFGNFHSILNVFSLVSINTYGEWLDVLVIGVVVSLAYILVLTPKNCTSEWELSFGQWETAHTHTHTIHRASDD